MSSSQPIVRTSNMNRAFACSPVAVLVFIVDKKGQILLLEHPERQGNWEVVNGALEANETVLEGALREMYEEVGSNIRVRPLGTVHVSTFHYDERVKYMISISYLMAYEGGEIQPGDDMAGSRYQWWRAEDIVKEGIDILIPPGEVWVLERAITLHSLWNEDDVVLQPPLSTMNPPTGKRHDN